MTAVDGATVMTTDIEGDVRNHLDQALKQVVARDEVGFGIDFDHDALGAFDRNADQSFGRDAPGLLGGLRQAFLAQPVDGGVDVACSFAERRSLIGLLSRSRCYSRCHFTC